MQQKSPDNLLASQAPTLPDSSSPQIVPMHLTRYPDQYPDPPAPSPSRQLDIAMETQLTNGGPAFYGQISENLPSTPVPKVWMTA